MAQTYTGTEQRLLNDFQRDFPLDPRPYARVAERLGLEEDEVLEILRDLKARRAFIRVGPVVRPNTVGASTLAAMKVPEARLEEVAAMVSARREVNHNYGRSHAYNLWFVVTAPDQDAVKRTLRLIEQETGLPVIDLPLLVEYHIDLGFDLKC